MRHRLQQRRRGMILLMVVVWFGVLVILVSVIGRYAFDEIHRERYAGLRACAEQLEHSARAWVQLHGAELTAGEPVKLPTAVLVPGGFTAGLTVQRMAAEAEPWVTCRVRVSRGPLNIDWHRSWPLASATKQPEMPPTP